MTFCRSLGEPFPTSHFEHLSFSEEHNEFSGKQKWDVILTKFVSRAHLTNEEMRIRVDLKCWPGHQVGNFRHFVLLY
jgi:hypothetical protein